MSSHAIKRTLAIVNRTPLKEKGIKKSSAFCTMTKVDPQTNATNKSKISAINSRFTQNDLPYLSIKNNTIPLLMNSGPC